MNRNATRKDSVTTMSNAAEQPPRSPAEHLKPHQWKPGQSGNPKGRKRGPSLLELMTDYLDQPWPGDSCRTRMQRLAEVLVDKSLGGDMGACKEVLLRVCPAVLKVRNEVAPKQIVLVMQPEDPPPGWDPLKALQEGKAPALPAVVDVDGTTDSDSE